MLTEVRQVIASTLFVNTASYVRAGNHEHWRQNAKMSATEEMSATRRDRSRENTCCLSRVTRFDG